jgi:hypothetical protein
MAIDPTGLVDKVIGMLPADLQPRAREARKAVVGGVGALLTALTLLTRFGALLPPDKRKALTVAISILTAAMTWLVPNSEPAP